MLLIKLPRLVRSKTQQLELDANRTPVLNPSFRLKSYVFLANLGVPHVEDMILEGIRWMAREYSLRRAGNLYLYIGGNCLFYWATPKVLSALIILFSK